MDTSTSRSCWSTRFLPWATSRSARSATSGLTRCSARTARSSSSATTNATFVDFAPEAYTSTKARWCSTLQSLRFWTATTPTTIMGPRSKVVERGGVGRWLEAAAWHHPLDESSWCRRSLSAGGSGCAGMRRPVLLLPRSRDRLDRRIRLSCGSIEHVPPMSLTLDERPPAPP